MEAKIGRNASSQEEQHQGKMHSSWKRFLIDRAHTRIIAIYLRTPRAKNGSVSLHGGSESSSIVRAIS
jgi:hypothetical protein